MLWTETKTPEEAEELQKWLWAIRANEGNGSVVYSVQNEGLVEHGEFWTKSIKELKDDPLKRLEMARRHLPLPAAFREAAISLRTIVRKGRKEGTSWDAPLEDLYRIAAIWSFYIPYAARLQQPGYNVLSRIPFSDFGSMSLTWDTLGYRLLQLLTETDRKLMREVWGEPPCHTTAHDKYHQVWTHYEDVLVRERDTLLGGLE
jgi:hypothetical protein